MEFNTDPQDNICVYVTIKGLNKKCRTHKIHVEIAQLPSSVMSREELGICVSSVFLKGKITGGETTFMGKDLPSPLDAHVQQITICDSNSVFDRKHLSYDEVELVTYVFKLNDEGPCSEDIGGSDGEDVPAATHWLVPSLDFNNLWETLVYDSDVKNQLLKFVTTTMLFSDNGVDSSIISWNRVLLLHGPPGTGKTSLCKALAQKLSIRLATRYQYCQLIEVNSHSLFSKWFSESGKLVQKMFSKIIELVEDPESLVFVLIDEVESLTRTRSSTANGADPSDALRVVNALLTQIDQIKRYPNVLILTTSNVTGNIDLAFVDRADIKQYVGLPSQSAIYQIFHSCLLELMKRNIISPREQLLTLRELHITNMTDNHITKSSLQLWKIADESVGLSGRTLRKLPFLAHALHTHSVVNSLPNFLRALRAAVQKHKDDGRKLNES